MTFNPRHGQQHEPPHHPHPHHYHHHHQPQQVSIFENKLGANDANDISMNTDELALFRERIAGREPVFRKLTQQLAAQRELKRTSDAVVATLTAQAARAERAAHQVAGANRAAAATRGAGAL